MWIACWLKHQTHDRKVASSNPGRSSVRIFFSRDNFVCWLLFSVRSTPMLPQWHVKDPGHSANNAGGRLHLNMHTPLTQRSWSGLTMHCPGIVWELVGKLVHTQLIKEHPVMVVSAHWADEDWSCPEECAQANLHFTTTTKVQAGNELWNTLPKSSHQKKMPHTPHKFASGSRSKLLSVRKTNKTKQNSTKFYPH